MTQQQTTPPPQQYAPQQPKSGNGFAVTALVLGIIAILGCLIPFVNILSGLLATLALIFGIVGLVQSNKRNAGKGMSIAGIVLAGLSILGVVLSGMVFTQAVDSAVKTGTSDLTKSASQPKAVDAPKADAPKADAPKADAPKAEPGIGTKVRDGKFEFVVSKVERPGKTITGEFGTTEKAQGEFVIVRVNISNIGDEAQMLMSSGQVLFNDKGQKFEPSSAILSLKDSSKFFFKNINPGNTVTGAPLLFDVAPGTKVASIELHDSILSDGVKVKLS